MSAPAPRLRRALERLLSIGEYPGEPPLQRAGRRVLIVGMVGALLLIIPAVLDSLSNGYTWDAVINAVAIAMTALSLVVIGRHPRRIAAILTALIALISMLAIPETILFGGLLPSGLVPVFGLLGILVALIAISIRAAVWWTAAYVASVVFAAAIEGRITPLYHRSQPATIAAFNLIVVGVVVVGMLVFFVRQRNRAQQRSDDLLHSILPDDIAERLKTDSAMIAEDFPAVSVLFADIAGFTPMSAAMPPAELVGLLNDAFTTIDRFVGELRLEKIKTIGDEYMAAAGVPLPRPDHAEAAAELALRIRDHFAATEARGHLLSFRIGINSGPVTAGIIGTHKFSYDLWGDTVNTASRMESGGVAGSIQVSAATYELIRDGFVCEPRGVTQVKGLGDMETYLLVSRRDRAPVPAS